jgi:RHS repeat-associated protein
LTDALGANSTRYYYYPYGGMQSTVGSDPNHYKFTGKERDTESGLDNFGKRYNASSLGRFMTPDPLLNSGQPWNPQTWNRYSYTLNNPVRYTDPLGLYVWGNCSGDADKCKTEQQRFRDSLANLKKSAEGLKEGSKERKRIEGVIGKLGEEGKGNIKINLGDAGKTNGVPNLGLTVGNNITINYDAVDSVKSDYHLNASESTALDAGVTGHEGTHAGSGPSVLGFVGMHFEKQAYTNESIVYQGLHNTDRPFGLWNESWATLDEKTLNQTRDQAVQHAIHPDTVPEPIPHEQK